MSDVQEAIDNPHYWLAAFGVRSHYFCWAVANGALDDIDPPAQLGGDGEQLDLIPGAVKPCPPKTPRRLYRSRAPNVSDVAGEYYLVKILPSRPRLTRKYVLR